MTGRAALMLTMLAGPAMGANLTVTVTGIRNAEGLVELCLFAKPAGFPDCSGDPSVARRRLPAQPGTLSTVFTGLVPGTYAVTAFHDEKRLGRVETNMLGMPRSGVGATRDPTARFGPPPFTDAAFTVTDRPGAVGLTIRYP